MLRTREEVNKIKGFTNSECPNHLGGCYILQTSLTEAKSKQLGKILFIRRIRC